MLINAYMDIKRKHIKFVSKNVSSSVIDYNFRRQYFAGGNAYWKVLHHEGVKIKSNRFAHSTSINLKEYNVQEIKRCEKENVGQRFLNTLNSCTKGGKVERGENSNDNHILDTLISYNRSGNTGNRGSVQTRVFETQSETTNKTAFHLQNTCNAMHIKRNNNFFHMIIRKGLHTANNQDEKGNKINVNIKEQIEHECASKHNIPTNSGKRNIQVEQKIRKNVEDIMSNIKNVKEEEKGVISSYRSRMTVVINNLFEKHLLLMNCLIAGTLYFIADVACQMMEVHKKNEYDFLRTVRMSVIGLTLEGPIMTWWYGKILAKFIKSKPNTFLYKSFIPTLFDNFIFGPIHLTIFFFYNGMLKNQKKSEIIDKIVNTGMKVFFISLMTWTPLTLINFVFVPRIYQATVVFFADFFWVIFLSWCANKT
ncbi:protein Mpv17, putative [Plasmodium ovale]|uniref:Protein Mpv17, putative n=1 Tax=Plasmodium ovale TaxID=36330 RepID=A0A1C3KKD7_PLAOA|nr:protein Mpv17, putative [Plasmodium ovale]